MKMQVLTEVDRIALANLCQAYSTMVQAQEALNEKGYLYKAPSGYIMQSPYLAIVNSCVDKITKLSREFGLTPASRSRIVSNGPTPFERAGAEIEWLMCQPLPYDMKAEVAASRQHTVTPKANLPGDAKES
jgi:P27 family predicted phage terminase small subunit